MDTSPLALPFPSAPMVAGVTPRVARAGYKDWGRCDLTFVELAEGTSVAGVFTRNVCCSTEVELGREQVVLGRARALVVNAGNSNAFTGYRGREAVEAIMGQVAAHLAHAQRVERGVMAAVEADHFMAALTQAAAQRLAEESTAAGDEDFHACCSFCVAAHTASVSRPILALWRISTGKPGCGRNAAMRAVCG